MTTAGRLEPGRVARAVEAIEAVCALPAIATHDWCERAAAAIGTLFEGDVVGLAIAEIDQSGTITRLEAAGVSGADPKGDRLGVIRRRMSNVQGLGWSLGDPSQWRGAQAARLADLPGGGSFPTTDAGRHWASVGVSELLVAVAPLSLDRPTRAMALEVGRADAGRPFELDEATLAAGVLKAAAKKALLAFGPEAISPARMLTPREQEVLEHLALGRSVKEIAARLSRSPHTVHDYVKALHRKLQASSRGALIAKALGHMHPGREVTITEIKAGRRSQVAAG